MRIFTLMVLLCFLFKAEARNFYFSISTGNDARSFEEAQNPSTPWKTIQKLNAVFQSIEPGDAIYFKRGDTFLGAINVSKSGRPNMPIVIGAYGSGARPVLTGLQSVTNWRSVGGGKYETDMAWYNDNFTKNHKKNENMLNMVVLNGRLQPIGRYPKANLQHNSYFTIQSHSGFTSVSSNQIGSIPNFVGGELVQRSMQWIFDRSIVKRQSSNTVESDPLISPDHPSKTYNSVDGNGFFFQNHIYTLTTLGDWSYNTSSGIMTMYFGGSDPYAYNVEVSAVHDVITLADREYVTIQDVHLKGSNEHLLYIDASQYCKFTNLDFSLAGINGIEVDRFYNFRTLFNEVNNCNFSNINNNALNLMESTYWTISDNKITTTGLVSGMGKSGDGQYIAIYKPGSNSVIQYNKIDAVGYIGVWFAGNNTVVQYNEISNYCLNKSDGGGIYSYGSTGSNRVVHKNIIYNGKGDRYGIAGEVNPYSGWVHGIYNDSHSSGVTISDNSVFNNSHSGMWIGSNMDISATGNTFYNNKTVQVKGADNEAVLTNINLSNNILFAKEKGSLLLSMNVSDNSIERTTYNGNYYCRPLLEPENVNGASGYSSVPFSWDTYHDGGIVEAHHRYYSLENWKKLKNKDLNSSKTPFQVTDAEDILFEFNASKESRTIALNGSYRDVKNNYYSSYTLAPFTSVILIKAQGSAKNNQVVNFPDVPTKNVADPSFDPNATATSGLPVTYQILSGPATVSGSTITLTGTGRVTVEASQPGNSFYNAAVSVTTSFTVAGSNPSNQSPKLNQSISFSSLPNKLTSDGPFVLMASATSQLPVSFRIVSGAANLSGEQLTLTGAGTIVIEATQPGNAQFNPAPSVRQSFLAVVPVPQAPVQAVKLNQSINFGSLPNKLLSDAPFKLNASASSNLAVNFRVASGPASISGDVVTTTGVGTVVIEAIQSGNSNYNAALTVRQSFMVSAPVAPVIPPVNTTKLNQSISFGSLVNKLAGDAPFSLNATASSQLPVNFTVVSGPAKVSANVVTLTGTGTVVIQATQPGSSHYNPAIPVVQNFSVYAQPTTSGCSASGSILLEEWDNAFGTNVTDIPLYNPPTNTRQISVLQTLNNGSNMGSRIRGYLCPPLSGNYTFYIAGDDGVELWLSSNDNPASKVKIAGFSGWTGFQEWSSASGFKSAQINLTAGQRYFIEVLHKNGAGGDHVSVRWDLPNGAIEAPIPGSRLSPYNSGASDPVSGTPAVPSSKKLNQSIFFNGLASRNLSEGSFVVNATASSQLPVSFRVVSGPASINGDRVNLSGAGTVVIEASQAGDIYFNPALPLIQSFIVLESVTKSCSATGTILREQWDDVHGNAIAAIPLFKQPSYTKQLTSLETENTGSNMGARISGYICPPLTGNYTFYIAGDDHVELLLSSDANPLNKARIAGVTGWTGLHEWDKYSSQKSATIYLRAGQSYYIEVLHKNGSGGDNMSVRWDLPDGKSEAPIPGSRLSPFKPTTTYNKGINGEPENSGTFSSNTIVSKATTEEAAPVVIEGSITTYPNPFMTTATVKVTPFETGQASLQVFDIQGRPVKTIFNGPVEAGKARTFVLDNNGLTSGVYIIRFATQTKVLTQKVSLTR